ncbi:MAG: sulfatase-like hydrolase/transferase [Vicinamibacterales bacterium]
MSRSVRHNFILIVVALSGCLAAFGGWRFAKASAPVNGPIVRSQSIRCARIISRRTATPMPGRLRSPLSPLTASSSNGHALRAADIAVARVAADGASAVRDRCARRRRVQPPLEHPHDRHLLQDRGYATGGIVSSFLLRKDTGINRGFAFFDDERPVSGTDVSASLTRDGMASEEVAEHWLDSIGTSRAFLFLHIAEPHPPHVAPTRLAALDGYDAEVAYADEVVARLIAFLKSHQLYDPSTILLVSDQRRRARRTWRAGAWSARIRARASRAADHQATRRCGSRTPGAGAGPVDRRRPDDPRFRQGTWREWPS